MNTILKLSSLYDDESWSLPDAMTLDLRSLEGCSCYCDPGAEKSIKTAITEAQTAGVHWIDTGDYHYISKFFLERLGEPFFLALFDNHPDDGQDTLGGGMLSCGNWVDACRRSIPFMQDDFRNVDSLPGEIPVYKAYALQAAL